MTPEQYIERYAHIQRIASSIDALRAESAGAETLTDTLDTLDDIVRKKARMLADDLAEMAHHYDRQPDANSNRYYTGAIFQALGRFAYPDRTLTGNGDHRQDYAVLGDLSYDIRKLSNSEPTAEPGTYAEAKED
jgi:hypothetical protein